MKNRNLFAIGMLAALLAIALSVAPAFAQTEESTPVINVVAPVSPIILAIVYGAFGYAHAKTQGQTFDGAKFLRAVAIGLTITVGAFVLGVPQENTTAGFESFAVVLVDQLVKIVQSWRTRAIASAKQAAAKTST